jgi:hypothetical protein
MLVISNGAMKSGSTWLTSILMELVKPEPLPEGFHDPRFDEVPTIKRERIREFLDTVDYRGHNYVSKNHFYYEREMLSRYENVYALDIQRDLADTLVSLFFHAKSKMKAWKAEDWGLEDIRAAYWEHGPQMAEGIVRYHAVWSPPAPWIYVTSYERLKADTAGEIGNMARFLGLSPPAEEIARIVEATSFKKMAGAERSADSGMDARFRKGVVGDSRNYFDDEILASIRSIEAEYADFPRTPEQKLAFAEESQRLSGTRYASPA